MSRIGASQLQIMMRTMLWREKRVRDDWRGVRGRSRNWDVAEVACLAACTWLCIASIALLPHEIQSPRPLVVSRRFPITAADHVPK